MGSGLSAPLVTGDAFHEGPGKRSDDGDTGEDTGGSIAITSDVRLATDVSPFTKLTREDGDEVYEVRNVRCE